MPSTMVHLMVAHEMKPDASGLFWVGNFAPDYTNDRELKDRIHLRNSDDRWASLEKLFFEINIENEFEYGYFIHLFADACWDKNQLIQHKNWYESIHSESKENWFLKYREEIGILTYHLYHHLPWADEIWHLIKDAQIGGISTSLPISIHELELYRDRVVSKHSESNPDQVPSFFSVADVMEFSQTTADRLKKWIAPYS